MMLTRLLLVSVFLWITLGSSVADARVERIEIVERRPFAGGKPFGDVGGYEVIRGRLHYAVPPEHPRNRLIADLRLATEGRLRTDLSAVIGGRVVEMIGDDPRNEAGDVVFEGDFLLLKPTQLERGNQRLLYGVNNRGNLLMLSYFNNAVGSNRPMTEAHAGNGWLMRQGYSLLWSAWNWDVENVGRQPLRINLPILMEADGQPFTASINAELAVQDRDGKVVERLAWGGSRCYPVVFDEKESAMLSVRDGPDAPRMPIARSDWKFATLDSHGVPKFDPVHVYFPRGFVKGKLYELIYTAQHSRVTGLGLAAVRDAISFFRFEDADDAGIPNPLAVAGKPDARHAYIFGISQSGRFITHMIYQGFHVDEQERMVFDGARPHVAGAGKGGFNYRFAQTTHHPKHLQGNYFPADHFPFHYTPPGKWQHDPFGTSGRSKGDVLEQAKALRRIPKVLISNHEGEYWARSASLVHTDVTGKEDAELHPNVRIYMVNGARHGVPGRGSRRVQRGSEHAQNQIDARPVGRALLVALDEWVSADREPPASCVPRIDQQQLVTVADHASRFPAIPSYVRGTVQYPALRHPAANLRPPRVDYGPRFWTEGIQDYVPPRAYGPRFVTLVPGFDRDGNPIGGVRLPSVAVPLGTHQGFNLRSSSVGAHAYLRAFECSFWPFALSRAEREQARDVRRSIEERYSSRDDYVQRVADAARALERKRLLLPEDVAEMVEFAQSIRWPPIPTDEWPFWELAGGDE